MGFIYSDLMVPPLVQVNAKYYGWKAAFYIAWVMFVSIVITALILNGTFALIDIVPEGRKAVSEIAQFKIDYTFWMNTVSVLIACTMILFRKRHQKLQANGHQHMNHGGGISFKRVVSYLFALLLAGGLVSYFLTR
jgi:hypothetical protein